MRAHHRAAGATPAARANLYAAAIACAVLLGACGGGPATAPPGPAGSGFPVTVTAPGGGPVTLQKRPARIVSLSPTATEMLFAIGAGPQVKAVDDQSSYPASAPRTSLSGFQPNVEAITTYGPDLVVAAEDAGGLVKGLAAAAIPVLVEPAASDLNAAYTEIEQLGTVTDHRPDADAVVRKMRADIAATVASVHRPARQLSVYHELDDTHYSATSHTFIGQVYVLLGLRNIADGAAGSVPDYPQLSAEYIVGANPDLIVLADTKCCHQDLQTVSARPGWGVIAAVRHGEVVPADDDVASRWGPRVVDFLRLVARHVSEVERQTG
jgi:iron complex transport system substrate-binding protein